MLLTYPPQTSLRILCLPLRKRILLTTRMLKPRIVSGVALLKEVSAYVSASEMHVPKEPSILIPIIPRSPKKLDATSPEHLPHVEECFTGEALLVLPIRIDLRCIDTNQSHVLLLSIVKPYLKGIAIEDTVNRHTIRGCIL